MSLDTKMLERELHKAQLENKYLKDLLNQRICYEVAMIEKTLRLCEIVGIPTEEVINFYDH